MFISYARPDEAQAKRVAEALQQLGYRVWRDDELPAHRAYAEVIEEELGRSFPEERLQGLRSLRELSDLVRSTD